MDTLTPMLRQYRAIKAEHPDAILMFRLGDFYEMFYDDALSASKALQLTLTSRGPMFYSQVRLGRHGRRFRIYKLRTMWHDCERRGGPRWATPGDTRITPVVIPIINASTNAWAEMIRVFFIPSMNTGK